MKTFTVLGRKPVLRPLLRLLWAALLVLPLFGAQAGVVLTSLYTFTLVPDGAEPQARLVQGSDDNFYGTTEYGGASDAGTVFKISATGALTSLYSFTNASDGGYPYAGLVQGSDGSFYGTTLIGGTNGGGTVFKISTDGTLTSLYSFTGGNDGLSPYAGLVQGSDGNFYGTTWGGGTNGAGTVFQISSNGALTSLYSFTGGSDGQYPLVGLVQGSDGNFYGTTSDFIPNSRAVGNGTVFKISTNGVLATLWSFTGSSDGANPEAGLVQGSDGNFYGTTEDGGANGAGTVFSISTSGALTNLYSFTGGNDVGNPVAGLVLGSDGNLYGTTEDGGTNGAGTVFSISTSGALTSLYSFGEYSFGEDFYDGAYPSAGLIQDTDGNLYGTTSGFLIHNSPDGQGTVFKISTKGALTTLYAFPVTPDGAFPYGGLVQGSDGNFYGTTEEGGTNDYGTAFKISTSGVLTSLYSFTDGSDGGNPVAGLVQGNDGYFCGTTEYGGIGGTIGVDGDGTVFEITTNGALTTLYSFTGGSDGQYPLVGLVQGSDGNFYGTTSDFIPNSRAVGNGTVFKISTNGVLATLWSFTGSSDGANPEAGLVQGSDGNLYGTTVGGGTNGFGTVFKISTNGALTSLYSFTGADDGANPQAGLVQWSDGNFYGSTGSGGAYTNYGTVFKISARGALTSLYSFGSVQDAYGNSLDGATPEASLVQGSDGNLYGTTQIGGTYANQFSLGWGTVFNISTSGVVTSLYSFTGGNDGGYPNGLVQGSDGNFYGTTQGGESGYGAIFRLTVVPELHALTLTKGTLSLTWSTEAGGVYQLQYNSNLSSSNWINLSNSVTATGATLSTTDSITNGPQRFYRLVLSP